MLDRGIRSLTSLERSASTSRVLNLAMTHQRHAGDPTLVQAPFFRNRALNHSIVVKHRLRPNEVEMFGRGQATTTKIMVPMDGSDLKIGARFLMVGQKDFNLCAEDMFGDALMPGQPDRQILELINELPSLDPFLLREHLKRHDISPARAYFAISDADIARMHEFVRAEISALVSISTGEGPGSHSHASRLVEKLLSNSPDNGFEPLKDTLRLNDREYLDGVFSWRGFLYYKWVLADLTPVLKPVLAEMQTLHPRGARSPEAAHYLPDGRRRLQLAVDATWKNVERMLAIYDKAFAALTCDGKPLAFRDFLLAAPNMFMDLGEQLGAVQHMVSFWRFRFPENRPRIIGPDELMDLLLDFEDSLQFFKAAPRLAQNA